MTTYKRIASDDSENSESQQSTVRNEELEGLLDEDHDSQIESQQDLDVRQAEEVEGGDRLCVSGLKNLSTKKKNVDRLRALLFVVSRVA